MSSPIESLRRSPLDGAHRASQAKMVPFGGWEMPLAYPGGTLAEHMACRSDAAAFDVSHLGTVRLEGPDAKAALQAAFTNDLDKISPGRAQYTHLLDDADGSVLDDIIVWWVDEERFDVMPNASNTARVRRAVGGTDVTSERAVVALAGPSARRKLATVSPEAASVGRFRVAPFVWRGVHCLAAGTGYTGEDGVECSIPASAAADFWESVCVAGFRPAGLGARDTLRLEAALPLHGHELGPGITPLQAGLAWVIAWDKAAGFPGRAALERERRAGVSRVLAGVIADGRQPPRAGATVVFDGKVVGEVTSGNFSPVMERGIGLALMEPSCEVGAAVEVEARGRRVAATVCALPFVAKKH